MTKLTIITLILLLLALRPIYEIVAHFYGARIKAWISHRLDIIHATKEWKKYNTRKLLKWLKKIETIEVVAIEEVIPEKKDNFDIVENGVRIPLEITNPKEKVLISS